MEKEFLRYIFMNVFWLLAGCLFVPIYSHYEISKSNWKKDLDEGDTTNLIFVIISILIIEIFVPISAFFSFGVPIFRDMPYIIDNEYLYVEGIVVELISTQKSIGEHELILIKDDETGKYIKISIRNAKPALDEHIIVKYLPNMEIGIVLEDEEEIANIVTSDLNMNTRQSNIMINTILIEIILFILIIIVLCSKHEKKKWMVYGKIELYKKMLLAIGGSFIAIIIFYIVKGRAAFGLCILLTCLCVLLFILGMTIQRMGIKKEADHILVVPIIGRKKKIYFDKLEEAVSYFEDRIEIKAKEKTILKINDGFYGYEEFCEFLKENGCHE